MSKARYLAAFGAAGLVFAAVFGAAAALDVNGGAVQAGQNENSLVCDTDGIRVASYNVDAEPPAQSSGVRIVDVNTACNQEELIVRVLDGEGDVLAGGITDGTIGQVRSGNGVTVRYDDGKTVNAADIEGISVAID